MKYDKDPCGKDPKNNSKMEADIAGLLDCLFFLALLIKSSRIKSNQKKALSASKCFLT